MGKTILITGGARSGKSKYAEKLAKDLNGNVLYIATAVPFDEEMTNRIKKHKESRPDTWDTYEGYNHLSKVIDKEGNNYKGILLDCITVMITNMVLNFGRVEYEDITFQEFEAVEADVFNEITLLLESIKNTQATVIMVTNELGSGVVPENMLARVFRDMAGRVNQFIAEKSDEVYLTVCGIPMKIKG